MRFALLLILASLIGCSQPEPPSARPANGAPDANAAPPMEAPEVRPEPVSQVHPSPRLDGPELSNAWLVILASNTELNLDPPGLTKILADDSTVVGARPGRLDSSHFKGLMPCYEVVVANATTDKGEALELSRQLKAAGIDHYVKNAGTYVGSRPAVEAFCERQRSGDVSSCTGGLRMAERWGGKVYVDLGLTGEVAARALATAGTATSVSGDGAAWAAPLTAQTLGDLSLGDAVHVASAADGAPSMCSLTRFVALTRGTPHWGWGEQGRPGPACGVEEVFAELDCDHQDVTLASVKALPARATTTGESSPASGELAAALRASQAWTDAVADAKEAANGEPVIEELTMTRWTLGDRELIQVDGWLRTGEGYDDCGGDDVNIVVRGVLAAEGGAPAVPFRVATYERWLGLLDVDGDGQIEVISRTFPSVTTIHQATGEPMCSVEVAYCDCPC
jgi:hypothetical protein